MGSIKKLAGQTAIYGLSSIIGRFLNYLLVPLHTSVFSTNQYGIITELYAYVAFIIIILTYGMETAYFRFSTKADSDNKNVFTTIIYSLFATTGIFIFLSIIFSQDIAVWLKYPDNKEFVVWFAFIVGLDAISSIPLARLRAENKAKRFAFINIVNVCVNILLNLFFLAYCHPLYEAGKTNFIIDLLYNPEIGVGYVFISNLVASIVKFLLLSPEMLKAKNKFEIQLMKKMILYALPLLIYGLAGIVNETIDRIMLKRMLYNTLGEKETMSQVGIYGACYKISIIITLFIQAFRYAAEPFYFGHEKEKNSKETYSKIMTYFVIVCAVIFLVTLMYMDIIKYFIPNKDYWVGLKVVPILLGANIFLGIYYNQSIWYKLTGKTTYGAYMGVFGAIITIALNFYWIPKIGYVGSAWATLICYASMMVLSYILGQKHYPLNYNFKKVFGYLALSLLLYLISLKLNIENISIKLSVNTAFILIFAAVIFLIEKPHKIKNIN